MNRNVNVQHSTFTCRGSSEAAAVESVKVEAEPAVKAGKGGNIGKLKVCVCGNRYFVIYVSFFSLV